MPPIGDTLRQARMRQKLDVADVEEKTKIRAKYLRALENEEFGLLPGSTFVKTFLRSYAEVLGLDPHVLVEEYRTHYEPRDELEVQPLPPSPRRRERERRRPPPIAAPGRGVVVAAVVGGLLVFLLVLGLVSGGGQSGDKKRASRAPTPAGKPRPQRRPHPVPRVVTVKVGPVTPTYVCVDNGPGTGIVFEGILQRPRTFRGKKLRINLGKRSASVTYDGRPVQIQPSPEPDGFEFSPSGRKEIPPTQRPCL